MIQKTETERIGVYVCHCGTNISHTVDVKDVVTQPDAVWGPLDGDTKSRLNHAETGIKEFLLSGIPLLFRCDDCFFIYRYLDFRESLHMY